MLRVNEDFRDSLEILIPSAEKLKESLTNKNYKIKENFVEDLIKVNDMLTGSRFMSLELSFLPEQAADFIKQVQVLEQSLTALAKTQDQLVVQNTINKDTLRRYDLMVNSNLMSLQQVVLDIRDRLRQELSESEQEINTLFDNMTQLLRFSIINQQPKEVQQIWINEMDSLKSMLVDGVYKEKFDLLERGLLKVFDRMHNASINIATVKRKNLNTLVTENLRRTTINEFFYRDYEITNEILSHINDIVDSIEKITKKLNHQIQVEKTILIKRYNQGNDIRKGKSVKYSFSNETDYYSNRLAYTNRKIINDLSGYIGKTIDWRYPIAYVEPNTHSLFKLLVAGDPFYWIDDYELPYKTLKKSTNEINYKKILYYTRQQAKENIESNQFGMVINWNNFFFKPIFEIKNDIKFMSELLAPGGTLIFDYIDVLTSKGAKAVEEHDLVPTDFDLIDSIAKENDFVLENKISPEESFCDVAVYRKKGNKVDLNLSNKLGFVVDKT